MKSDKTVLLHVITSTYVGGAESMLLKLCNSLKAKDISNVVVSLRPKGKIAYELEKIGIPVYSLDMNKGPLEFFRSVKQLRQVIKKYQPAGIYSWMYHANLLTWVANAFSSIPLFWNIRQCLPSIKGQTTSLPILLVTALMSHFVPKVIYNSQLSIKHHRKIGYKASNAVFIPNGFDTQRFSFNQTIRDELRSQLGLEENFVIGIVGRYDPIKGHSYFVDAINQLDLDQVKGLMIGRELNNDNLGLTPEQANQRFVFIEESAQIEQWYSVFDLAVCCSISEGFPNVVGEAMSCECPVLVTDVGDAAYLVGSSGRVIDPQSVTQLEQAMGEFHTMSPKQRREIGLTLRTRIKDHFTIDQISERFIELLD